jgi:chromosomal replication initiator protein DnaA
MKGANKKLGELLIREDVITRPQLEEALREKHSSGLFLGEILVRLKYVTEDELIGFLVRQCRIPHLKLSNLQVSSEVAELIPAEICHEYKLLPIDKLGTLLTVAMVNPLDVEALEKVKQTGKLRIKPILCSWADFKDLYAKIYGSKERKVTQAHEEIPEEFEEHPAEREEPASGPPSKKPEKPEKPEKPRKKASPEKQKTPPEDGLIERFAFDNFVVAEANSFTYALARSIAESPGSEYNPFFIYGNTGLGKTHLSNAIGNEVVRREGYMGAVYAPASRFIDEMLDAVEHDRMKEFRERYNGVDLLVVDDIQFLSGRTRAQEEFFNIFNAIYNRKKQIILVSDVPPKKLEGLEQRLISRFEGGVVACLEEPDFQTRLTILRQRTGAAGATVTDDVLELLAKSIPSNIRELEGALKKLLAYSSLVGHEITLELAQEILKHLFKTTET